MLLFVPYMRSFPSDETLLNFFTFEAVVVELEVTVVAAAAEGPPRRARTTAWPRQNSSESFF